MNDSIVSMKIPEVEAMAKSFATISDVLNTVAKALQALILILKTTAFIGLVGGYAIAQYLETIKPYIEQIAEKCSKISQGITASVEAFKNGDDLGAEPFRELIGA